MNDAVDSAERHRLATSNFESFGCSGGGNMIDRVSDGCSCCEYLYDSYSIIVNVMCV